MKHLLSLLRANNLTLTTAESCTGGMVAAAVTDISGASEIYNQGYITYSNEAKHHILGVPQHILTKFGAVSTETAQAMAEGALRAARADIAIATTGIAGPTGGTLEKPVGTVYIAIASHITPTHISRLSLTGTRHEIRKQTVNSAIVLATDYLELTSSHIDFT